MIKSKTKTFSILLLTPLAVIALWASVTLAQSMDDVENPQDGSIGIEGAVPGPPPESAATINTPISGQTFTSLPITVSGTCEPGLMVEVYKNDVFSGVDECAQNGTYSVDIDLFFGENELIVRVRDLLGQAGPDSNIVTVIYNPPVEQSGRDFPAQQLLLTSTTSFRGVDPGSEIVFPIALSGGIGPYAISITWGDGSSDVMSRSDTGSFNLRHVYDQPGVYRMVVKATDDTDTVAFLQLVAVVNGEPGEAADSTAAARIITNVVLWPLFIILPLVPIAFWMGVHYQKRRYGA